MNTHYKLGLAMLAGIAIGALMIEGLIAQANPPSSIPGAQQESVKRTVLLRTDLEGMEGKEAVIFLAELAPGAVGAKHYHPGSEFFYVLEGTLVHEPEGGPPHAMKAGEVGSNPYKGVHTVKNPSMTERTKALDFLIADKSQPLVVPVK
jgi:quercetin dioxygenase-like cupin family protein